MPHKKHPRIRCKYTFRIWQMDRINFPYKHRFHLCNYNVKRTEQGILSTVVLINATKTYTNSPIVFFRTQIIHAFAIYSFPGTPSGHITLILFSNIFHSQHIHHGWQEEPSTAIAERCTRSRINSAIFVSSEGRGFDSIEFLRRHGSQSVLCRKARSAENITDEDRKVSVRSLTK